MCFYAPDDYDWIAQVWGKEDVVSTGKMRCCECHKRIPAGTTCQETYCQQYEECRVCTQEHREEWDDEYDGSPIQPCEEGQCDFGESSTEYTCQSCLKLLAAIKAVELAEGCPEHSSQPNQTELTEALWESDHGSEYIDKAREMYPELALSGYLDSMYTHTREWSREIEDPQWYSQYDERKPDDLYDMVGGQG